MKEMQCRLLNQEEIQSIEEVLAKGDRVELIPGPDHSVKILHIKRQIVKAEQKKSSTIC